MRIVNQTSVGSGERAAAGIEKVAPNQIRHVKRAPKNSIRCGEPERFWHDFVLQLVGGEIASQPDQSLVECDG